MDGLLQAAREQRRLEMERELCEKPGAERWITGEEKIEIFG